MGLVPSSMSSAPSAASRHRTAVPIPGCVGMRLLRQAGIFIPETRGTCSLPTPLRRLSRPTESTSARRHVTMPGKAALVRTHSVGIASRGVPHPKTCFLGVKNGANLTDPTCITQVALEVLRHDDTNQRLAYTCSAGNGS